MTARTEPPVSVLVYGDVNMNIIDGSSVWTQSVCLALASVSRVTVTLLLKTPQTNDRLLSPLVKHPNVEIVDPGPSKGDPSNPEELTPKKASELIDGLSNWDRVLVRGFAVADTLAGLPELNGRLWVYLTDVPQNAVDVTTQSEQSMGRIGSAAEVVFCQTEELRSFMEANFPEVRGKAWLLPPAIPNELTPDGGPPPSPSDLRLVYSGKFASAWNTLDMSRLPKALADRGVSASLTVLGDKFNRDPNDPGYVEAMRASLETAPGVQWLGGMSRDEALAQAGKAHVALSWRDRSMNDSLELSTKLIEYCAVGTPPVLNRTPMHEALLGSDYPLFADTERDVVGVLERIANDPVTHDTALSRTAGVRGDFTLASNAARLTRLVNRHLPPASTANRPSAVLVMSHDFKFFEPLRSHLTASPDFELKTDRWHTLNDHDPEVSRDLMESADTIICEWCGPNAAFASKTKRPNQRLIVRLHRFEIYAGYWRNVDIDAVDTVVTVSPHYRRMTLETTGWPEDKVISIPNYVDLEQLNRPKMTDARFHIGMIGIAPSRKRLDLALEVTGSLRSVDPRFVLFVKSKPPWEYPWYWEKPGEKEHYAHAFRKLQDPALHNAVAFDDFGANVGAWLRKIGFVVSTSDDESFHLAPAEGMASGAVPVIRDWPGAETIYDPHWITEVSRMADRILSVAGDEESWLAESERAVSEVRNQFDINTVNARWRRLLQPST